MIPRISVACVLAALGLASCSPGAAEQSIRIEMRGSRFEPAAITVAAGTTVTFQLINADPIAHEFIVGTRAEQLAHEHGAEQSHDGTPGAASLGPYENDVVTVRFDEAGTLEYACHMPGHYGYGMAGELAVS